MKIKLFSDIHLGFRLDYEPNLEGIDVLCLAGDIGEGLTAWEFSDKLLKKYPILKIVEVPGNHLYYSSHRMEKIDRRMKEKSEENDRYFFLNNSSVVIDNVRFIGSTLWTDFNRMNSTDIYNIQFGLNDYKYITTEKLNYKGITPFFVNYLYEQSKEYIFNELNNSKEVCIVVTHHQPFLTESNSVLKYAFEVDLTDDFNKAERLCTYWFSGHTHCSHRISKPFTNGEVVFISNQLGYPNEDTGFQEDLVIEI